MRNFLGLQEQLRRMPVLPAAYLDGFRGILQVVGYDTYRNPDGPTLARCRSHARRKFYEIAEGGHTPIAAEALRRIGELYAIEAEIHGISPQARSEARQARSRPLNEELRLWLEAQLARLSGKSALASAVRYILKHWDGLVRFIDERHIEIDNNVVVRTIRPIALNRKNALFAGYDKGGEHWAVIASLIEICKLNDVNPHDYLSDTLERLVTGHPNSRIDELLPWTHAATQDV